MTSPYRVRLATQHDMPLIHDMIKELASYEGVPDGPQLTVDDLINDGFESSPPWFIALVAERMVADNATAAAGARAVAVGYAIFNRAYSSWTRRALYLEDLYVREEARREGVARALVRRVCALAAADRCSRLDWHVLEENAPARAFYSRLGARDLRTTEGRTTMRLDETYITALAAEDATATPTGTGTTPEDISFPRL